MKLSILMPVYNEFATLTRAVKEVLEVDYPCEMELVIVDDGSTDGTRELYGSFALDPRIRVQLHESNLGKGAAIRTAVRAAVGDYVIMCDADLEYSPTEIPRLLTPVLRGEAEVVYGTRAFSSHNSYSYLYVLGNKAVTTTANTLFNCYLSDLETCFKLMPRHLYLALEVREQGFGMEAEITGKLLRRGIRPYEVPISYQARSREEGKKMAQVAAAAGAAVVGAATVYLLFDERAVVPGLITFWYKHFPPMGRGPAAVLRFLRLYGHARLADLGLGEVWLTAALVLLGLVALVKSARPALALTVALLVPELFALGALRKYPFLDLRTSTFLLVVIVVTAAVGVAWLCGKVAGDAPGRRRVAALVLATTCALAFTAGAADRIRSHPLRLEDVRGQAAYVYLHRAPGDAILLLPETSVNFAYYWPGPLARTRSAVSLQGYVVAFPGQAQIISAVHTDRAPITAVLADAVARMREFHGTRIWAIGLPDFVRRPLWEEAYREAGLDVRPVAGTHGLEVLVPRSAPSLTRSAEPGVSQPAQARKTVG